MCPLTDKLTAIQMTVVTFSHDTSINNLTDMETATKDMLNLIHTLMMEHSDNMLPNAAYGK